MSNGYEKPHVSIEFIDASSPGVKYPTTLRVQLVGHLAQIEEDQYVGDYDNDSDLIADVPNVLTGATIIEDLVTVEIVLDGNGETIEVPADSGNNWTINTTTNVITIKSGIVDVNLDETETPVVAHTECSGDPAYDWRTGDTTFTDSNLATGFSTDTEAAIGDYLLIDQLANGGVAGDATISAHRIVAVGNDLTVEGTLPVAGDKASGDVDSYKIVEALHYGELDVDTDIFSDDTQEFDELGIVAAYSQIVIYEQDGTANGPYDISLQSDGTLLVLGSPVWPAEICIENLEYKIVMKGDGKAYVGYYALRSDLSEDRLRLTPGTLATALGGEQNIAIDNPAAINAWLALQIADEVFISCPNETDVGAFLDNSLCDETEWSTTLDHLKTYTMLESAYSFVCLAQNAQIISLLELFVDWMRDPDRHKLLCGYGSFPRVSEDVPVTTDDVEVGNNGTTTFTDSTKDFTALGALQGAYLELTDTNGTIYKRQVSAVGSTTLTLYVATPTTVTTDWDYRVVNAYYTPYEEATNYKAYAQAYANRAFRLVWPQSLRAIFKGTEYLVPSYMWQTYWTAMLAASDSISLPHTNVKVNFFFTESVLPSAEFKDETILDTIASGGIEIVMQDTPTSPLYSRHQLTTDMTSVNTREQSVVHQFDYAGMVLLMNFESLVGTIELDEKGLALLKTIFTACQRHVVDERQALRELNLIYLEVDPDSSDLILMEVEGQGRPPFNGGHIKFYMV